MNINVADVLKHKRFLGFSNWKNKPVFGGWSFLTIGRKSSEEESRRQRSFSRYILRPPFEMKAFQTFTTDNVLRTGEADVCFKLKRLKTLLLQLKTHLHQT